MTDFFTSDNENEQMKSNKFKISNTGKLLIGITGGVGIGLSIICAPFVSPALRKHCLPYVPATNQQIRNVFAVVPNGYQGLLLDIGSGDGRIVIEAAKQGIRSHGVELNPWLVYYSRMSALRHRVFDMTKFYRKDLWKFNVRPYDCVVIFGVEQMMPEIEQKLLAELKENSRIIACRFPLPTLTPNRTIEGGVDTVWTYHIK